MAQDLNRAEINKKLSSTHNIKDPCEVFGRGFDEEIEECKSCKTDCKEYAVTCSNLTKGIDIGEKKGGIVGKEKGNLVLESNSDKKDSKTLNTKGNTKMSTTVKEKVKKKVRAKSNGKKKAGKFVDYREGSSAYIVYHTVLDSKKGLTPSEIFKKVKGKFETSNLMGRIQRVLYDKLNEGRLKKNGDGVYSKK